MGWSPPKNFKGEPLKFGLKFSMFAHVTLGLVGVTSWNFSTQHAARGRCDNLGTTFERDTLNQVKNMKNSTGFLTTFDFDRKNLQNGST